MEQTCVLPLDDLWILGRFNQVECKVHPRDMVPVTRQDKLRAQLVVVDLGAARADSLNPEQVCMSKAVADRYMCCPPVRLKGSGSRVVTVCPEPRCFVGKQATVGLIVVKLSSVLGNDKWVCISRKPVPVVVRNVFPNEDAFYKGAVKMLSRCACLEACIAAVGDRDAAAEIERVLDDMYMILRNAYGNFKPGPAAQLKLDGTLSGAAHPNHAHFNFLFPAHVGLELSPFEDGILRRLRAAAVPVVTALRRAACTSDARLVRGSRSLEHVGEVQAAQPPETHRVDVGCEHGLCVDDEIAIGDDFNRVRGFGSIKTYFTVALSNDSGRLSRLWVRPVIPADNAIEGKTQNFLDNVENVEGYDNAQHDHLLLQLLRHRVASWDHPHGVLPPDVAERKQLMVNLYTGNDLYKDVNRALYKDSAEDLREFAPFIRELRDVFLAGQRGPAIVEPFCGVVTRRMKLTSEELQLYTQKKDQKVYWAAFTSTSEAGKGGNDSFGKSLFKIHCNVQKEDVRAGQYFPADIAKHSKFKNENEVLLPPYSCFRIINVLYASGKSSEVEAVEMESCELPSVWHMCDERQWDNFCAWAEAHPDIIDTRSRHFSIINAVAANLVQAPTSAQHPLLVCIKLGANVNEIDSRTGKTPLISVAEHQRRKQDEGDGSGDLEDTLRLLLGKGAHPNLISRRLSEVLPDFDPADNRKDSADRKLRVSWMYWVDDGVDGKETGWYGYVDEAGKAVEAKFQKWLDCPGDEALAKILSIHSGTWAYNLDFTKMQQTNTTNNKVRKVRRHEQDIAKEMGLCPAGFEWVMEEKGWRCRGGMHVVPFHE